MKQTIRKWISALSLSVMALAAVTSCSMMHQDLSDCPVGLYLTLKYDYNLQRANMFSDHVGEVTVYVYDEQGNFVTKQTETNTEGYASLKSPIYSMHMKLPEGKYKFIVLAGQKSYESMMAAPGAKFVRNEPQPGDPMENLWVELGHTPLEGEQEGLFEVKNEGLPLDTIWHGMLTEPVEVFEASPTYDTISLVRNTKHINITIREMADPTKMDIADYELKITDSNAKLRWDNTVDETDRLVYKPYRTWNTDDKEPAVDMNGDPLEGVGRTGHADFMTSRIIWRSDTRNGREESKAILSVTYNDKANGKKEVIKVDLADMLARLATSAETMYSPQEFLDRGYDYRMSFYLLNGEWRYTLLSIDVLGWAVRIDNVEL